jgi:predicted nucleic acid-binding protein
VSEAVLASFIRIVTHHRVYLAALATEHGATWVTTDRGFARFPSLRWTTPLT